MGELAAWLLEQIAEDEADPGHLVGCGSDGNQWADGQHREDRCDCVLPARVRAECEARRLRIELHSERLVTINDYETHAPNTSVCRACSYDEDSMGADEYTPYPCPTLRTETLPFVDRPGYREEWRP